ncbi:MAG: diacylglycerol kinase family protein [Myxococcota bacterium]|nr:diacylglycerol kinase family protein [Myxococcota bacterium]
MHIHNISSDKSFPEQPHYQTVNREKVAVILNQNARLVTKDLVGRCRGIVGSDNVFYSASLDEAEAISRELVQKGYGTVACGGGDGTLTGTINFIRKYVDEANRWRLSQSEKFGNSQQLLPMPRFAFLKLGTGNGIAPVVGARHPLKDLKRLVSLVPGRSHYLPMIDVGGQYCFLAGLGYDSIILNDYNRMKNNTNHPLLKSLMHSVLGYLFAAITRTVPRMLSGHSGLEVNVSTHSDAYFVDSRRGDASILLPAGTTL